MASDVAKVNLSNRSGFQGFAIPMAGWSRLQINMEVQKAFGVPLLGRIPDGMVLPIVWISSGVNQEDLPQKILDILYRLHHTVRAVVAILEWSSLVGMILSMGALLVCFKKYRMEHPDVGLQMNSVDQNKLLEVS